MSNIGKPTNSLFRKIVYSISSILFIAMLLFIWVQGWIFGKDVFNYSSYRRWIRIPLLVIGTILLFIFMRYAFLRISKMSTKRAFICSGFLFVIMLSIYAVLMCNLRIIPQNDSRSILDQALTFAKTNTTSIDTNSIYYNYFSKYSNNYLLTILFSYFFKLLEGLGIKDYYLGLYFVNALCLVLGTFFTWVSVVRIRGARSGLKVLLLFTLNPIYYLMMFWIYSNTLSIPFMMGLFMLGILIYTTNNFTLQGIYSITGGLLAAVAFNIRPTAVFPVIALFVAWLLYAFSRIVGNIIRYVYNKDKNALTSDWFVNNLVTWIMVFVFFIGTFVSGHNLINTINDDYFGSASAGNYPVTHWLMMGSHDEGKYNLEDDHFTFNLPDDEKQKVTLNRTINNYRNLGFSGTFDLWRDKATTLWSDGSFDCSSRLKQNTKYSPIYKFVGGSYANTTRLYCQCFWLAIILMALLSQINALLKRQLDSFQFFSVVTIFGATIFYFVWEVKPAYAIPFLPFFFMIAADMSNESILGNFLKIQYNKLVSAKKSAEDETLEKDVKEDLPKYVKWPVYKFYLKVLSALQILALYGSYVLAVILLQNGAIDMKNEQVYDNYSIKMCGSTWMYDVEMNDNDCIVQGFYPENKFNEISFRVKKELINAPADKGECFSAGASLELLNWLFEIPDSCMFSYDKFNVTITDSNQEEVYSTTVTSEDINGTVATIKLDKTLEAAPRGGYIIRIQKGTMRSEEFNNYVFEIGDSLDDILSLKECDLVLLNRKGIRLDSYKGDCFCCGKALSTDFHMSVTYNKANN